ncbi:ParB/RepB/Spo0J family partition protein [Leptolyngbya sp. 7M]|uniref:ParB/RepB/Spo0J family partition protein n=1 Tax=Leptolyngbya sp. 7M TaxID=2812896 RepID=UPI001B8C7995|nr:ParB/RepB/Spo0J family partition protein [Leptolyngbya sp. 7M]QYO66234.1 ParB/RepB/Spo0J family partition protein [Leptolyngbya sp. 7M]
MARKPLGRGLSALLGEPARENADQDALTVVAKGVTEIDITRISGNPEQPRTRFDEKALDELAASIAANGIVQPIVVREKGDQYQIVAGERRWRAAQRAGLSRVPVVVREVDDDHIVELALIENIQREDLNPIEEAAAYRKLIDTIGLTQEQIAERVGKERSLIATALRLLKLPEEIQKLIEEGKLSAGHGRALLLSDDRSTQIRAAREMIERQMSVREAERTIKRATSRPSAKPQNKISERSIDPNLRYAETKMMRALGTNVKIRPGNKDGAGRIEIEYYNNDDLDRIFQLLMGRSSEAAFSE